MVPRSYTFIGLNVVRALSIIGLILVFSSSILVMVTNIRAVNAFQAAVQSGNSTQEEFLDNCDYIDGSNVPNQAAGVFWAVVSTLLIIAQSIILFLSECSWPLPFFDRFFPVIGTNFGLGPLGIFQCLIGAQILSHHVDEFTLVAAFFLFSIGCLNMLLGLVFRESAKPKRSIRAWREEGRGVFDVVTPPQAGTKSMSVFAPVTPAMTGSSQFTSTEKDIEKGPASEFGVKRNSSSGFGFGRQGEKKAGLKGFILQRPEETLPRYASPTPPPPPFAAATPMPEPVSMPAPDHAEADVTDSETASRSTKISFGRRFSRLSRKKSTQTTKTSRTSTSSFQSPGTPGYYSERDSAYEAYPGPYHHYPNQDRLQAAVAAQAQASTSNLSTPSRYPDDDDDGLSYASDREDEEEEKVRRDPFRRQSPQSLRVPYGGPPAFKSSNTAL
ncbi:hypothetical protein VKT23_010973 [Stygiomarasmius scandens]|uniref:DUF7598 domain-containing protein n=1 Tax=Marasmiellus scandens TaxID=2682957 RepID=A0ABR1JE72_9AGAR